MLHLINLNDYLNIQFPGPGDFDFVYLIPFKRSVFPNMVPGAVRKVDKVDVKLLVGDKWL